MTNAWPEYFSDNAFKPPHLKRAENFITHVVPILSLYSGLGEHQIYKMAEHNIKTLKKNSQVIGAMTKKDKVDLAKSLDRYDIESAIMTQVAVLATSGTYATLNKLGVLLDQQGHLWGAEPYNGQERISQNNDLDGLAWILNGIFTFI